MTDLALALIRAQIAASLFILAVLAVRRWARRLVGARIAYTLWLLPVIAAGAALLPPRIAYVEAPAAAPASALSAPVQVPQAIAPDK